MKDFQLVQSKHCVLVSVPPAVNEELKYRIAQDTLHAEIVVRHLLLKLRNQRRHERLARQSQIKARLLTVPNGFLYGFSVFGRDLYRLGFKMSAQNQRFLLMELVAKRNHEAIEQLYSDVQEIHTDLETLARETEELKPFFVTAGYPEIYSELEEECPF